MPSSLSIVRKFYPQVESIVDGKRNVTLTVSQRAIDKSRRLDHSGCAMAEAIAETLELDGVVISTRTCYFVKGKVATRYEVREHVSREIVSFDRGAEFVPGAYTLHKPYPRAARGTSKRHPGDPAPGKLKHRKVLHQATEGIRDPLNTVRSE